MNSAPAAQVQAVDRFHKIIADITAERSRQDAKFGEQNHPPQDWLAILMEEVGEFARAHMEVFYFQPPEPGMSAEAVATMKAQFIAKRLHVREELVQVAAVAVAMLEACDRNNWVGRERREGQRRVGQRRDPATGFMSPAGEGPRLASTRRKIVERRRK